MNNSDFERNLLGNHIIIKFSFLFIKFNLGVRKEIFYNFVEKFWKINNRRILFSNFHGMGYGCNPKYIANEILKNKSDYELYWVTDKTRTKDFSSIPKTIKQVEKHSLKFWYVFLTSKILVVNTTLAAFYNIEKRKGQVLIQTGHGSLGIKKVGIDDTTSSDKKLALIDKESKETDYFISNSKFETLVYNRAFKYPLSIIKEFGHPRNDILYSDKEIITDKVKKNYNINKETKILLYVPTFRKDGRFDCFDINYELLRDALNKKFGGDWKIMARFHPRTIPYVNKFFKENEYTINATKYEDIQELLVASDVAITDYSSCIFDFMLSYKPAFIYATDFEQFDQDQGCYYPLSSTPFPIARNNKELVDSVSKFDNKMYLQEINKFLEDKGCLEDGHASERIADLIEGIINK